MSLRGMAEEIEREEDDLQRFGSFLRKSLFHVPKAADLVFAGSGDSFATAIFAQELSKGRSLGSDPYELLMRIDRVRRKTLVIVSVSGRTRTNLMLAQRATRLADERIAITADSSSPLARECDRVIELRYNQSGILTSGTTSFTCGLIACARLLRKLPQKFRLGTTSPGFSKWVKSISPLQNGTLVFTGSGVNYAMALYGAAKFNEVTGTKAEAVFPEQLGHARLFAVDKRNDLILYIHDGKDRAWTIGEMLRKAGFRAYPVKTAKSDPVNRCVNVAIQLQFLALKQAQKNSMTECAFITKRSSLTLSNKMIY